MRSLPTLLQLAGGYPQFRVISTCRNLLVPKFVPNYLEFLELCVQLEIFLSKYINVFDKVFNPARSLSRRQQGFKPPWGRQDKSTGYIVRCSPFFVCLLIYVSIDAKAPRNPVAPWLSFSISLNIPGRFKPVFKTRQAVSSEIALYFTYRAMHSTDIQLHSTDTAVFRPFWPKKQ